MPRDVMPPSLSLARAQMSDRFAVIFIALLIVVTNMQSDLGLGRLTYLMWLDGFNASQLLLTLLVAGEAIAIHALNSRNQPEFAFHVDAACRPVILWVIYPGITVAAIMIGLSANPTPLVNFGTAGALAGLTLALSAALIPLLTRRGVERMERGRNRCVAAFLKVHEADPRWRKRASDLFTSFDVDESGAIDSQELRTVLMRLYPHLESETGGTRLREVLHEVRTTCADVATGQLDLPAFMDALQVVASKRLDQPMGGGQAVNGRGDGRGGAPRDVDAEVQPDELLNFLQSGDGAFSPSLGFNPEASGSEGPSPSSSSSRPARGLLGFNESALENPNSVRRMRAPLSGKAVRMDPPSAAPPPRNINEPGWV